MDNRCPTVQRMSENLVGVTIELLGAWFDTPRFGKRRRTAVVGPVVDNM